MLVLGRKAGQSIYVGEEIIVTVVDIQYGQAKIGIQAPASVLILRDDAKNIRDLAGQVHPAVLTGNVRKNEL